MFKRLFDIDGKEILKSEDILRGMEYYVSAGETFISPLRAINCKLNSFSFSCFHLISSSSGISTTFGMDNLGYSTKLCQTCAQIS